jgi:large subunit ribosomal protein L25
MDTGLNFAKVNVELRQQHGKGGARKVRAAGKVPGVLYGRRQTPVSVAFDGRLLVKALDKDKRRNTVFTLTLSGEGTNEEVTAMIRDAQIDPISQTLVHVDFLRVDMNEEVQVTVPLALVGRAIGVVNGGQLHQSMHVLSIAAKPAAIPTKIEVDVSGLDIGSALHVSDLKLAAGVRALIEAKESVASVVAPKAEKAEAETTAAEGAAAPAEGAAAAAGGDKAAAGGDKAAGGAKAGDKAAAAAPKKEDKKK